jgi:hypothetical protein
MRWTLALNDERRWRRTAKSCGPDAPTLTSSWRMYPPTTVATKPGHRGARRKPLKPLRAGRPGDSGDTCSDYARVLFCLHPRLRVQLAPGVPHALIFGRMDQARPGCFAPRDRERAAGRKSKNGNHRRLRRLFPLNRENNHGTKIFEESIRQGRARDEEAQRRDIEEWPLGAEGY